MNQQESLHFFSVLRKFKKMDIGLLMDGLSHSEFMILGLIKHKKMPFECPRTEECEISCHAEKGCDIESDLSNEKDITVSDIAAKLSISSPAVSRMIGHLEERNLVIRYTDRSDRRNKYVRLTEQGQELCEKNERRMKEFFEEVVDKMGKEDMHQLSSLLSKLSSVSMEVMEEYNKEGRK